MSLPFIISPPTRLGFNADLQQLKEDTLEHENTYDLSKEDKHDLSLFGGVKHCARTALLFSVLPCVLAKCVFAVAWTNLAIVAATLFTLTALTTPFPFCCPDWKNWGNDSNDLFAITFLLNAFALFSAIIIQGIYTCMAPSPLSIASLLLMIATPVLDYYADKSTVTALDEVKRKAQNCSEEMVESLDEDESSQKTEEGLKAAETERRATRIMFGAGSQKSQGIKDTIQNIWEDAQAMGRDALYAPRLKTRFVLTIAWGAVYMLTPTALPLQQTFMSVFFIRNIVLFLFSHNLGL